MRKKITKNISTAFLISILASALLSTNTYAQRFTTVTIPSVNDLKISDVTSTSVTLYWGIPDNLSEQKIAAFEIYKDNVLQEVVPRTMSVVQFQAYPHWSHRISGLYESSSHVFSIKIKPIASITDYVAQTASISVTTPERSVPGVYYIPYGTSPCSYLDRGGVVGKVLFNTINNSSTSFNHILRYSDFTGVSTNVAKGATYNLTVKPANPIGSSYPIGPVSYAAWIDFNRNFKFEPDELVLTKNLVTDEAVTVPVNIPTTAVEGPTRLRILVNNIESRYMGPVEPVDFTTVGEFEDYTINILDSEAPSAPSNLAVSNVTATSLTLNWTASTDNFAVTAYDVYANDVLIKTVRTNTVSLSGLTQGKPYSFYVKAKDAAGNASAASNTVFTTTLDAQAPTAPTGLAAADIKGTSLTLKWTPSTDNLGIAGYDVYKDGSLLATVTNNTANITGLIQYTSYRFYVTAKDAAGNVSPASSTISATTLDSQAPTTPTGLTVTGITETSLTLKWTPSNDNAGVVGYDIYKDGTLFATVTNNTANITGLKPNTAYSFYVKAKDATGNISAASNAVSVKMADNQAPTAPTNLKATNISARAFNLSWTASTDNIGIASYDIYLNDAFFLTISPSSNFSIISLYPGATYRVYLIAKDAAGNASPASASLTVALLDTQAPSAPTNLTASNVADASLTLNWAVSTDNAAVTGYDVYRNGVLYTTTTSNTLNVNRLSGRTTYQFFVQAKDAAGNVSAASNTVSVTTTGGKKSLVIEGEEAAAAASKIVIYPNPTEAQLFISDIERIGSIYIFDSFGKQVYGAKATKEVNVTSLTSGVYLIMLKFKDGSTDTSRFIKK